MKICDFMFNSRMQIFDGNTNSYDIVESLFAEPVLAIKVRIVPLEWNGFIALRFELLGCKWVTSHFRN